MDLIFLNGEMQGGRYPLTPPGICIGSEADNDLQLLVDGVAPYHAKISFDGTNWYIEDLGSETGILLNQSLILEPAILTQGMEITIGSQNFSFGIIKATQKQEVAFAAGSADPAEAAQTEQPDLASEIRKSKFSIFNGTQKNNTVPKSGKKSKLGNLIFTLLIITLPLVGIFGYMMFEKQKELKAKQTKVKAAEHPFFFYYERIIQEQDNVFRFEARIEENKIRFTIDDLKYGRHAVKEKELDKAKINELKKELKNHNSDFAKLNVNDENTPDGPVKIKRRIDLGMEGLFNSVTVTSSGITSFQKVEEIFYDFSRRDDDMRVGLLTAEEMLKEAHEQFVRGQELFANYQASPKNIREAVEAYQAALSNYNYFEPKPKPWSICQKQFDIANNIYKEKYKALRFDIQKYYKENKYAEASKACSKMMELLHPKSEDYQKFRNYKIEFDKKSKETKKMKKK